MTQNSGTLPASLATGSSRPSTVLRRRICTRVCRWSSPEAAGLNCDWNTKWIETGIFSDVFVPPVANDSGSAIGTAIDAQLHFTGEAKIEWNVYSGLPFRMDPPVVPSRYDVRDASYEEVADMLNHGLILGGSAAGTRSILALSEIGPFSLRRSMTV